MQVTSRVCDVNTCKVLPQICESFSMFKERKTDGAGSGEDWYWKFDLCQRHTVSCLQWLLEETIKETSPFILTPEGFFERFHIKARVE